MCSETVGVGRNRTTERRSRDGGWLPQWLDKARQVSVVEYRGLLGEEPINNSLSVTKEDAEIVRWTTEWKTMVHLTVSKMMTIIDYRIIYTRQFCTNCSWPISVVAALYVHSVRGCSWREGWSKCDNPFGHVRGKPNSVQLRCSSDSRSQAHRRWWFHDGISTLCNSESLECSSGGRQRLKNEREGDPSTAFSTIIETI